MSFVLYTTITNTIPQYHDEQGNPANGFVLKAYEQGTTTATSMYTDENGSGATTTFDLDSFGFPTSGGNPLIPYLDTNVDYRFRLYENSSDASSDTNAVAEWEPGKVEKVRFEDLVGVVDSVSDLQSGSFPTSLDTLYLSGYYGSGTPGGGELYADRADNSTADNGGTVFVDSDGVRWKRPPSKTVTMEQFGAKAEGTGGFNNTTVFQAVFDYLESLSGGVAVMENDDRTGYYLTDTVYIRTGVTLEGKGKDLTVIRPMTDWNASQDLLKASIIGGYLVSNVHFRDFSVFNHVSGGDDETLDMPALHINGTRSSTGVENDSDSSTWTDVFENFSFVNLSFQNVSDSGIKITGNYNRNAVDTDAWVRQIRVLGCDFEKSNNLNGQLLHFDAQPGRILISNCSFIGPFSERKTNNQVRYALRFQSGRDITVSNCYFYDWDGQDGGYSGGVNNRWNGAGIHCQRSGWGVRNLTVTNCVFYRTGCGVSTRHGNSNINIVGNTFEEIYMACLQIMDNDDYVGDLPENFRAISINFSDNVCRLWGGLNNTPYRYAVHSLTHKFDMLNISNNTFLGDPDNPSVRRYIDTTATTTGQDLTALNVKDNVLRHVSRVGVPFPQAYREAGSKYIFGDSITLSSGTWDRIDDSVVGVIPNSGENQNRYAFTGHARIDMITSGDSIEVQIADQTRSTIYSSTSITAGGSAEDIDILSIDSELTPPTDGGEPVFLWVNAQNGGRLSQYYIQKSKSADEIYDGVVP